MEENKEKVVEEKVQEVKPEAPKNEQGEKAPEQKAENSSRRPRRNPERDRRVKRENKAKDYDEIVVHINRVAKVVKGGKTFKFSALVVVGDRKGKFGFAIGKAAEVPDAIKKAVEKAKKNLFTVSLVGSQTLPHEIIGKFGATKVYLKPALEGTGIIAGGAVRRVLELAGVKNVYSKVYGSRTPINVVRATDNALRSLKSYTKVNELRK